MEHGSRMPGLSGVICRAAPAATRALIGHPALATAEGHDASVLGVTSGADLMRTGAALTVFMTVLLVLQLKVMQTWAFFKRQGDARRWFLGINVALVALGVTTIIVGIVAVAMDRTFG